MQISKKYLVAKLFPLNYSLAGQYMLRYCPGVFVSIHHESIHQIYLLLFSRLFLHLLEFDIIYARHI